jgi:hypothetical protein
VILIEMRRKSGSNILSVARYRDDLCVWIGRATPQSKTVRIGLPNLRAVEVSRFPDATLPGWSRVAVLGRKWLVKFTHGSGRAPVVASSAAGRLSIEAM